MECLRLADAVEKVENRTKSKISQMVILDYSAAAMLCSADTKVRGRFLRHDVVPHVAAHETHLELQKISLVTNTFSTASARTGQLQRLSTSRLLGASR